MLACLDLLGRNRKIVILSSGRNRNGDAFKRWNKQSKLVKFEVGVACDTPCTIHQLRARGLKARSVTSGDKDRNRSLGILLEPFRESVDRVEAVVTNSAEKGRPREDSGDEVGKSTPSCISDPCRDSADLAVTLKSSLPAISRECSSSCAVQLPPFPANHEAASWYGQCAGEIFKRP